MKHEMGTGLEQERSELRKADKSLEEFNGERKREKWAVNQM